MAAPQELKFDIVMYREVLKMFFTRTTTPISTCSTKLDRKQCLGVGDSDLFK